MIVRKILIIIGLLVGSYSIGFSQIQYKIELLNGQDLYQVSLVSHLDFEYPNNIIGSAQITIKAPAKGFQLGKIQSLLQEVEWENNAIVTAPAEAPDFQYLSFALKTLGSTLPLKKDLEVPLFTFVNELGSCPGKVYLIDNQSDSFLPPNSSNANIGNQITPFACAILRNKNAYLGNIAGGFADCSLSTSLETVDKLLTLELALNPNPAQNWINAIIGTSNLKEEMFVQIWQAGGKLLHEEKIEKILSQETQIKMDIKFLAAGYYSLLLKQGNNIITQNFVKIMQ